MPTITPDVLPKAKLLTSARHRLNDAGKSVTQTALRSEDPMEAFLLGQLAEAIDVAEQAIFNVLSTASSMCDSKAAKAAIDQYYEEREAARAKAAAK